jgi:hypothetical protein
LLAAGLNPCHVRYAVNRFPQKADLSHILKPGDHGDWGLLNLYVHILAYEQKSPIVHIPWDLVTPGIQSDCDCDETVNSLFTISEFNPFHYKLQWVR